MKLILQMVNSDTDMRSNLSKSIELARCQIGELNWETDLEKRIKNLAVVT